MTESAPRLFCITPSDDVSKAAGWRLIASLRMKVIHENPYRLLGVYANSPAKERVANMRRLTAFMKVGKQVSFPLDLPDILGDATRTDESIAEANSRLTLPKDQFHYSQFWFAKLTPLDDIAFNLLTSGDTAKAIEIWGKKASASSYQNIITCSLARRDYATAIRFAEAFYANASYVAELAEAVTGNRDIVTAKAASMDFIDTLCNELSLETILPLITNADWKRHLTDRTVKPLIESIEAAISAAENSGKEPIARYNAGVKLYYDTKVPLQKLAQLISKSDLQYQLIADKVGLEIQACAANYYNDSDDPNAARKAMSLQRCAEWVVVGAAAKEKCKENTKSLQEIIDDLPPEAVVVEAKAIQTELKKYVNLNQTIANAVSLLTSTKPQLQSIKHKLGATNQYYLKQSTLIVNIALSFLIEEVNRVQKAMSGSGETLPIVRLLQVRSAVENAWNATKIMDTFDMEPDFRNGRYKENRATLRKMYDDLGCSTPPSSGSSGSSSSETPWGCIVVIIIAAILFFIGVCSK